MKRFFIGLAMLLAAMLPAQAQQSIKADQITATTLLLLPYVSGSTQCLQVDTTGHVSGAGAACGSGGGGGGPLEQHTASNSSSLDFTTGISSSCDVYDLDLSGMVLASSGADLTVVLGTSTGPTWSTANYGWTRNAVQFQNGVAGAASSMGVVDTSILLFPNIDISANQSLSGKLEFHNLRSSSLYKTVTGDLVSWFNPSGVVSYESNLGGQWDDITVVTGIRVIASTGNIATGVATLTCASGVGGGGSPLIVDDGVTTVNPVTQITFTSGATVTDAGGGVADVAVTGGGGGSFRGAMVHLTGDQTISSSITAVPWDAADYDTDSFWSGGSPTRLTVPSGVTHVKITGQIKVNSAVASVAVGGIVFQKNGAAFPGWNGSLEKLALQNYQVSVSTPVIPVTAGDYFTMEVDMDSGTLKAANENTTFSIEAVP